MRNRAKLGVMKTHDLHVTVVMTAVFCCLATRSHAAPPLSKGAEVRAIALPGASPTGVGMDLIAYDRSRHRVWVPAGNTGSVDVVDTADGHVTRLEGFATAEIERNGKKRTVGPSSATVGDDYVYVGNRGDSSVCAIEAKSLHKDSCLRLDSPPDALVYVRGTKEVWATTPRRDAIVIIDARKGSPLAVKAEVRLDGSPEGYAIDDGRGVFYTNLEDKDRTLALDVRSRKVTGNWQSSCGEGGPKGLAVDRSMDFVLLACPDRVKVLDVGHGGKELSTIETGAGVDDIAYLEARHELYVGAAKAAKLTIAILDAKGGLAVEASVPTAPGARNAVVTDEGVAYLTDSPEGKLLVVSPSHP
jgi:DNA-binding beta-propeller fold protein YncE